MKRSTLRSFMMCAADVCRSSLGGTVAEVGVSEKNRDHRNGKEPKLEREILKDTSNKDKEKQEEEKESKLVAGISLDHKQGFERRGKEVEDFENAKHKAPVEREGADRTAMNTLTPALNTTQLWETSEIPERPSLPAPAEVLQQPGRGLARLRGSLGLHSQEVSTVVRPEKYAFLPIMLTEAPKASRLQSINQYMKAESNFTVETKGNKHVDPTALWKTKAQTSLLTEQAFKSTEEQNAATLSPFQQGQPQKRGSKSNKVAEPKESKKTDKRTPKVPKRKKQNFPPTHFPYFLDDYCPPECACYGG